MELAREAGELDDTVDNYHDETYKKITDYLRTHPEETNTTCTIIIHQKSLP